MLFQSPLELSKGEVRLKEADRQSVPQTWSGDSERTIAEACTASDDRIDGGRQRKRVDSRPSSTVGLAHAAL